MGLTFEGLDPRNGFKGRNPRTIDVNHSNAEKLEVSSGVAPRDTSGEALRHISSIGESDKVITTIFAGRLSSFAL